MMHVNHLPATDSRHDSSKSLWISALVLGGVFFYMQHNLLISTVKFWAPWADTTNTFAAGNNALRGLIYSSVALLGAVLAWNRPAPLHFGNWLSLLVAGFLGWCCLSVVWSDNPQVTVIRLGVLGISCISAFGLSRGVTPSGLLKLTLLILVAYVFIGLGAEVVLGTFRPWEAEYRFAGTLHPNAQGGNLSAILLVAYCQIRWLKGHRLRWAALFAITFGFLCLTKSRTALGALVLAIGMMELVAVSSWKRALTALTFAWAGCVIALPVVAFGIDLRDEVTQAVHMGRQEDSEELNGRQPVWEALMPYIGERLWTGYGFESFWNERHIDEVQWMARWHVRDAHSMYLNIALGVGVVGTALFVAMLLATAWRLIVEFQTTAHPAFAFLFGLTVYFLAAGTLESNTATPSLEILLLYTGVAHLAFPTDARVLSMVRSKAIDTKTIVQPTSLAAWRTS